MNAYERVSTSYDRNPSPLVYPQLEKRSVSTMALGSLIPPDTCCHEYYVSLVSHSLKATAKLGEFLKGPPKVFLEPRLVVGIDL